MHQEEVIHTMATGRVEGRWRDDVWASLQDHHQVYFHHQLIHHQPHNKINNNGGGG